MTQSIRLQHIVQWRLAVIAGICAGAVFLVVNSLYLALGAHVGTWVALRYMASIVLGPRVLPPPATFDAGIMLVGLVVNFALAILYALILAAIIHRWGLLVGLIGGGLYGAALYGITIYTFTLWYPWFFALNSIPFFLSFVLFGVVAGGVYESLDYDDAPLFPQRADGGTKQ